MAFGTAFSPSKLKTQLKMAVSRFQIASNKKSVLMQQNMRQVAILLAEDPPKEEKARIRAEALIRDDNLIEAYEILQLECELLVERIKLVEYSKICPPDLVSCISTLIYAGPRVDISELTLIRKQFIAKYGKKFADNAKNNINGVLNERVVSKLSIHPPAAYLVHTYLEKICEQYEVDWKPTIKLSAEQMIEPMPAPVGYSVPLAQGTGLGPVVTGQRNIDDEISYQSPSGKSDQVTSLTTPPSNPSISPQYRSPSVPPPVVAASDIPTGISINGHKDDNVSGIDVFVPQNSPSHKVGDTVNVEMDKNDERNGGSHDNDDDGVDGATSNSGPSYDLLAARFNALDK